MRAFLNYLEHLLKFQNMRTVEYILWCRSKRGVVNPWTGGGAKLVYFIFLPKKFHEILEKMLIGRGEVAYHNSKPFVLCIGGSRGSAPPPPPLRAKISSFTYSFRKKLVI